MPIEEKIYDFDKRIKISVSLYLIGSLILFGFLINFLMRIWFSYKENVILAFIFIVVFVLLGVLYIGYHEFKIFSHLKVILSKEKIRITHHGLNRSFSWTSFTDIKKVKDKKPVSLENKKIGEYYCDWLRIYEKEELRIELPMPSHSMWLIISPATFLIHDFESLTDDIYKFWDK